MSTMAPRLPVKLFLDGDEPQGRLPALAALWHAHRGAWERAHALVQDAAGPEAAWVHGHLHRLEGDIPNASYWYRRAGRAMPGCDPSAERTAMIETLLEER